MTACESDSGSDEGSDTLSSAKAMTAFSITVDGTTYTGTINGTDIAVTVPHGTDVTALVATFSVSAKATVKVGETVQESGVTANDFTSPVTYTVVAEDGTTQNYTVTVTVAEALSSEKSMTTFSLGVSGETVNIDENNHAIAVTVPHGTDVTALVATFTASPNATVNIGGAAQTSGVTPNDFANDVIYTVVAEDESTQEYTVTVTVAEALSSENTMTAFSLGVADETVHINPKSHVITVIVPHGTDVTNLAASFTVPQGATVKKRKRDGSTVTNIVQESGVTTNDFSGGDSFSYLVIAEDGTARVYELSVFEGPESTYKLQSVSIAGQPCQFYPPDDGPAFYTEALFYDVNVTDAQVDYTIADDYTLYISGTPTKVVNGQNYDVGFDDDGNPKCLVDAASDLDPDDETTYPLIGRATKIPYIETLTVSGYSVSGAGATSVSVKQVEYANPSGSSAELLVEFQVELPADVENFETDSFQVTFDISLESDAPNSDFNWKTADSPGQILGDVWSDNTTVVNVGAETVYYLRQVLGEEDEDNDAIAARAYRIVFTKASN